MRSKRICPLLLATFSLVSGFVSLRAEDWKTIDGRVYQDVTVLKTEPDAVTILHEDGGALVPLELQKRFNYDPDKARAAADRRMQEELADARALRIERALAEQLREAREAAEVSAATPSPVPTTPAVTPSSSTHFTMDSIASSAGSLHRDLTDPDYHTIGHLGAEIHSLGPDPNDPNHHSISEITGN